MPIVDLTGQRFGRLTVIAYVGKIGKEHMWKCKCDCGNIVTTRGTSLKSGKTKSCGCYNRDVHIKHGKRYDKLYSRWIGMKDRCCRPSSRYYYRYGGRGIKVCEEWVNSFEAFYEWAYANGYDESLTIDRINNDGDYEPSNCRWVDMKVQSNNKRSSRYIEYANKKMTVAEWSAYTGIKQGTLLVRLNSGWPIDEVLGIKPHLSKRLYRNVEDIRHVVIDGKKKSVSEIAKDLCVDTRVIYRKLDKLSEDDFITYYHDMMNKKER